MSQEHDQTAPSSGDASDDIHAEASPFEPGFQPDSLPQISVPHIPEDAIGLTAEALAQVPTLTDQVEEIKPEVSMAEVAIQEAPAEADTWREQLHVRMDKLTDEIHQLNARLDRLAENKHTEV